MHQPQSHQPQSHQIHMLRIQTAMIYWRFKNWHQGRPRGRISVCHFTNNWTSKYSRKHWEMISPQSGRYHLRDRRKPVYCHLHHMLHGKPTIHWWLYSRITGESGILSHMWYVGRFSSQSLCKAHYLSSFVTSCWTQFLTLKGNIIKMLFGEKGSVHLSHVEKWPRATQITSKVRSVFQIIANSLYSIQNCCIN